MPATDAETSEQPIMLSYGSVEGLLIELTGFGERSVASRFRKLRPRFASDGLLTKPGNRVDYDLQRVLAIAGIYLVNSIGIPQSHATDMVIGNWPEVARACIVAASEAGLMPNTPTIPTDASDVVAFCADSFIPDGSPDGHLMSWAQDGAKAEHRVQLMVSFQPVIAAIAAVLDRTSQSRRAAGDFAALESNFGWSRRRDEVIAPIRRGSAIFGDGPYFLRAKVLLAAQEADLERTSTRTMLQTLLEYVENPAPIDDWKMFLDTDESSPRLVHLLGARGMQLGLRSRFVTSETMLTAAGDARQKATALIEQAEGRWPAAD